MSILVTHDAASSGRYILSDGGMTFTAPGAFAASLVLPEGASLAALVDLSKVKTNARLTQLLSSVGASAATAVGGISRSLFVGGGFPEADKSRTADGRTVDLLGPFGETGPSADVAVFIWRPGFSSANVAASMVRGGSKFGPREVAIVINDAIGQGTRQTLGADIATLTAGVTSALSGVLA